jgi:hypothetical protein
MWRRTGAIIMLIQSKSKLTDEGCEQNDIFTFRLAHKMSDMTDLFTKFFGIFIILCLSKFDFGLVHSTIEISNIFLGLFLIFPHSVNNKREQFLDSI